MPSTAQAGCSTSGPSQWRNVGWQRTSPHGSPAPALRRRAARPCRQDTRLQLRVGPLDRPSQADNLLELFQEIEDLGTLETLDGGQAEGGIRRFKLVASRRRASSWTCSPSMWRVSKCSSSRWTPPLRHAAAPAPSDEQKGYGFFSGAPASLPRLLRRRRPASKDLGYGFFDDAPGSPDKGGRPATAVAPAPASLPAAPKGRPAPRPSRPPPPRSTPPPSAVSVDKVDQLINLVGETGDHAGHAGPEQPAADPPSTRRCWPAWPTWTATPATCKKR